MVLMKMSNVVVVVVVVLVIVVIVVAVVVVTTVVLFDVRHFVPRLRSQNDFHAQEINFLHRRDFNEDPIA